MNLPADASAAAPRARPAPGRRVSRDRAGRAEETPFRRIAADFAASRLALFGLALFALIVLVRAVRAADLAAEPLRPRAARRHGQPARAGRAVGRRQARLLARHRRPGPRHALGDLLRPAHQPRRRRRARRCSRSRSGLAMGLAAAYFGGRVEALHHAHRRHPALVPGDPDRADPARGARPGRSTRSSSRWSRCSGRTTRARCAARRSSSARRSTWRRRGASRCPPSRIVFRHLLPNCLPPLIVVATVQVAAAIALEATLSFLGLGLPITEPSLGLLIANGFTYLLSGKYWISFFPGVALLAHDREHQPRRRPAARRAEPAAAAMSEPTLEVEGLRTHFFTRRAW